MSRTTITVLKADRRVGRTECQAHPSGQETRNGQLGSPRPFPRPAARNCRHRDGVAAGAPYAPRGIASGSLGRIGVCRRD